MLIAVLVGSSAMAQVQVTSKIDSLQMLIGQQTKIRLEVTLNKSQKAIFPEFNDSVSVAEGIELVEKEKMDTAYLNDGTRMRLTQNYIITAWDSALYSIPEMVVKVGNQEYKTNRLVLKVLSIPVDTLHPEKFFGPKPTMVVPFSWDDWAGIFYVSLLLIVVVVIIAYLFINFKQNKPIIRRIKVEPKIPAHQKAMAQIQSIKNVDASVDSKDYFTKLTDVIREYIKERYNFSALEMTSGEIIAKLTEMHDDKALDELRDLFMTADLVKFAKYEVVIDENDKNLVNAVKYINETKIEETLEDTKPKVIIVEETKTKKSKYFMLAAMVVLAALSAAGLCYIIYVIYNLYN